MTNELSKTKAPLPTQPGEDQDSAELYAAVRAQAAMLRGADRDAEQWQAAADHLAEDKED